jgi:hypothetical protein
MTHMMNGTKARRLGGQSGEMLAVPAMMVERT